ncbi:MAG: ABC transporter ATP-binding protein [Actinomycetota bacterium]|nr:ABC transporter ATP-binding protein [Actinomycetota bacterium]
MSDGTPLLSVEDLRVRFQTEDGAVKAVEGVSFEVRRGEVLAIVGESGCGKSVTAMSLMGLTRGPNAEITGRATLGGTDLIAAEESELRKVRGNEIAMIFQDPMSSLNPVHRVGAQIVEQIQAHDDISDTDAKERAVELLRSVGIPGAEERADSYPHEFSGGMRQRAMIAMGLSVEPDLLIADEPTTALDVTIQAQIMRLLRKLNEDRGLATILITHDLGVVAQVADRILVMYAGEIVESGTLEEIFYDPQHPYTWGLLGSVMRLDRERSDRLSQIKGQPPSLASPPEGCKFRPRCPHAFEKCTEHPTLKDRAGEGAHLDRCWLDAERKRSLRTLQSGDIGLEAA